jgi:hypothetical protein
LSPIDDNSGYLTLWLDTPQAHPIYLGPGGGACVPLKRTTSEHIHQV